LGTPPDHQWSPADLDEAVALLHRHCDVAEARGKTGDALGWAVARERLVAELLVTLQADSQFRRTYAMVPVAVEDAFGFDDVEPATLPLADGRVLRFRGFIDRVDRSADGLVMVTDYKTGKVIGTNDADRGLEVGTRLQLPIYALRAKQSHPDAAQVAARYWYISRRGDWATRGIVLDEARLERLGAVVSAIVEGMDAGVFPANPGDDAINCAWCPFDRICPADRDDEWVRVHRGKAFEPYLKLASGAVGQPAPGESGAIAAGDRGAAAGGNGSGATVGADDAA
jgi:ATP-dependent helicase/nuclease subunit B